MVVLTLAASAPTTLLLFVSAFHLCMADCDHVVYANLEKLPEAGTKVDFWNLLLAYVLKSGHCMRVLEPLWVASPCVSRLHVLYASVSCQKRRAVSTAMTAFSPEALCQSVRACCASAATGNATLAV